jgi:hypothetical protein
MPVSFYDSILFCAVSKRFGLAASICGLKIPYQSKNPVGRDLDADAKNEIGAQAVHHLLAARSHPAEEPGREGIADIDQRAHDDDGQKNG